MATNVTQKDKTLNEIIDWAKSRCHEAGRSAPPTAVEIEAVAKKLLWWDMAPAWEDVMPSGDCFWTLAEPEMRANYLRDAREMLETARKAVSE